MARLLKRKRHFVMIDKAVYSSLAWRTLPDPAMRLWIDLRTLYTGGNNGLITPTFASLRPLGWTSKSKSERALAELIGRGFLRYTRKTGRNVYHRASRVAFTDLSTVKNDDEGLVGIAPTNDFLTWQPPAKPRFTFPAKRGATAPLEGDEPPREKGNDEAEPPREKGNGKSARKPRLALVSGETAAS
jgi:hypothetical protein